jgi:hypothetical protein
MAENGKVKVGIIGSQFASELQAEGSTFGNSDPGQSEYASSHQLRYVGAPISSGSIQLSSITRSGRRYNYVGCAEFPLLHPGAHAAGAAVCTSNYILMVSSVKLIRRGKELARNVS